MSQRGCNANLKVLDNENIVWESPVFDHNHKPKKKFKRQIKMKRTQRKSIEKILSMTFQIITFILHNSTNLSTTHYVKYIKHNIILMYGEIIIQNNFVDQQIYKINVQGANSMHKSQKPIQQAKMFIT